LSQSSCIAGMHCRDALLSGNQTHSNHCDRHPSEVPEGGLLVQDSDRQQHRQCRSDRTDDRRTRRPDPHDARARTPCLIREWTPRPRGLSKAKCFDGDSSSCWRLRGALPKTLDYVSEARQFLRELSRSKHDSNVLAESILIRFEPFTKLSGRFPHLQFGEFSRAGGHITRRDLGNLQPFGPADACTSVCFAASV
jgi:hypothetical protein